MRCKAHWLQLKASSGLLSSASSLFLISFMVEPWQPSVWWLISRILAVFHIRHNFPGPEERQGFINKCIIAAQPWPCDPCSQEYTQIPSPLRKDLLHETDLHPKWNGSQRHWRASRNVIQYRSFPGPRELIVNRCHWNDDHRGVVALLNWQAVSLGGNYSVDAGGKIKSEVVSCQMSWITHSYWWGNMRFEHEANLVITNIFGNIT